MFQREIASSAPLPPVGSNMLPPTFVRVHGGSHIDLDSDRGGSYLDVDIGGGGQLWLMLPREAQIKIDARTVVDPETGVEREFYVIYQIPSVKVRGPRTVTVAGITFLDQSDSNPVQGLLGLTR